MPDPSPRLRPSRFPQPSSAAAPTVAALLLLCGAAARADAPPTSTFTTFPEPHTEQCEVPPSLFPEELQQQGISGDVKLRVEVDEKGHAADVQVLKPVHPKLDALSVMWMKRRCTFEPARDEEGRPVRAVISYTFVWRIAPDAAQAARTDGRPARLEAPATEPITLFSVPMTGSWSRPEPTAPGFAIRRPLWYERRQICTLPCKPTLLPDEHYFFDGPRMVRTIAFQLPPGTGPIAIRVAPASQAARIVSALAVGIGAAALLGASALYLDASRRDALQNTRGWVKPLDWDFSFSGTERTAGMAMLITGGISLVAGIVGLALTRSKVTFPPAGVAF